MLATETQLGMGFLKLTELQQMALRNRWMSWIRCEDVMRISTLCCAMFLSSRKRRCAFASRCARMVPMTDGYLHWEGAADDGYLWAEKWLKVIFLWHMSAIFHPDPYGLKKYFQDLTETEKERQGENILWPKTKHIPCCVPTKLGSRPLNQKRCLEGDLIKQILKECFIHNTSWCYFVPTWTYFIAVFGSLYGAFCCSAL